jgi:hypothetical protein
VPFLSVTGFTNFEAPKRIGEIIKGNQPFPSALPQYQPLLLNSDTPSDPTSNVPKDYKIPSLVLPSLSQDHGRSRNSFVLPHNTTDLLQPLRFRVQLMCKALTEVLYLDRINQYVGLYKVPLSRDALAQLADIRNLNSLNPLKGNKHIRLPALTAHWETLALKDAVEEFDWTWPEYVQHKAFTSENERKS